MSGVLVDTHMALWALGSPERLTAAERDVLVDPGVDRRLSPVSVWEAAIKREAGRLRATRDLAAVLTSEFRMLDVSAALLEMAAGLPRHHSDPFDRVLIATHCMTISACSRVTSRSPTTACASRCENA